MAVTDFSWASMTPATNCWPPLITFACAGGVAVAVAVRAVRAAAGLRLRDFEAVRLREDAAVLRVRGFAAVLARGFGFGLAFGLAVGLGGRRVRTWRASASWTWRASRWADVVSFDARPASRRSASGRYR